MIEGDGDPPASQNSEILLLTPVEISDGSLIQYGGPAIPILLKWLELDAQQTFNVQPSRVCVSTITVLSFTSIISAVT